MNYYMRGAPCLAGITLLIIYCVGMFQTTWFLVHRYDFKGKVLAKTGLFTACGFDSSMHIKESLMNPSSWGGLNDCVSLLEAGFPGWLRAVQFFSILCLFLLSVIAIMWLFIITLGDLGNKRQWVPMYVLLVVTGLLLMVHPIIFAVHMRPRELRIPSTNFLYDEIVYNWLYWGSFILHCIVAGVVNFFSLLSGCCIYCCTR